MTQPQQPFGEARACPGACAYCGRPLGDATVSMIDGRLYHWQCTMPPAELVSRRFPAAEPVDAAELLKRQAAQIAALQVRVGVQDARIAALEDETRRLWRALAAAQKAQAL